MCDIFYSGREFLLIPPLLWLLWGFINLKIMRNIKRVQGNSFSKGDVVFGFILPPHLMMILFITYNWKHCFGRRSNLDRFLSGEIDINDKPYKKK